MMSHMIYPNAQLLTPAFLLRSKTLMVRRALIDTGASSACTRGCPFERTWSEIEVLTNDGVDER